MQKQKTEPAAFERFVALTRHILTTPKAVLVKDSPKRKPAKRRAVKK